MKTLVLFSILLLAKIAIAGDLPGDSIYQLESQWYNQDNKKIELKEFAGQPVILSMIYLTCQYACPTITSEIISLKEKLPKKVADKTKVVLISFDPRRDTSPVMSAYFKKRKLDIATWTIISNQDEEKIRELAAVLGFKYKKTDENDFTHSFMIFVLNKNGQIVESLDGIGKEKNQLITALEKIVNN